MRLKSWLSMLGVIGIVVTMAGGLRAATSPREALGDLESVAAGLRDGGGLEKKPARLVEKLLSTIEKAKGVDEEDDARFLRRLGAVMKRVERAGKAGVDLSEPADALDAAVALLVDGYLGQAEGLASILVEDAHVRKVERLVARGRKALGKAEENSVGKKRSKLHANAARRFIAAARKGEQYRVEEIESGVLSLTVESVLLDDSALTEGRDIEEGQHLLEIHADLPMDWELVSPDTIVVEKKEGELVEYFPVALVPSDDPLVLEAVFPALLPGDYTLLIRGEDDEVGPPLQGRFQVPLRDTLRIGFTVVLAGPP